MTKSILRIDSSASTANSKTRALADRVVAYHPDAQIVTRDVAATPLPIITQEWAQARLIPAQDRTAEQNESLALSDVLIAELRGADTIIIGAPIYNFAIPASLKSWIDLIARPKETFAYTETGPVGLLEGKRAYVVMASGGVPIGSSMDFASGYMRHVLGFVGITDVQFITEDTIEAVLSDETATAA